MKTLLLLFLALVSAPAIAQSAETVICGTVRAEAKDFNPFSYSGIMFTEYRNGKEYSYSSMSVDKNGHFSRRFPKQATIKLYPYYKDYYKTDTLIRTGHSDTIRIDFTLVKKNYYYSEAGAQRDIAAGRLLLIVSDTGLYNRSVRAPYTAQFHFSYVLWPEPSDYEFRDNRDRYNWAMMQHLDSVNKEGWRDRLYAIEDSLEFLAADRYGRTHRIDLNALVFPAGHPLSPVMQSAIAEQEKDYKRLFTSRGDTLKYTEQFMLAMIDTSANYRYLFEGQFWITQHYEKMIPELIRRLTDKKFVGLTNTADLIIWERNAAGDLKYWGHGGIVADDLFTVAGRANYLLKAVTGENFGTVSMYATPEDLVRLQNRWAYWLLQMGEK